MQNKKPNIIRLIASIFVIVAATMSLSAMSMPLTGTPPGTFIGLPFPGDTGAPNAFNPIFTDANGSFNGTWDNTAAASAWHGTITGTPDRIRKAPGNTGTEEMNFSGLTNGYLPENTFFVLGDLDQGSQSGEFISLRAWDISNSPILVPWLDEPTFQDGTNDPQLASMLPDFNWDSTTGTYTFDGNGETFPGNPSTVVFMHNNQRILRLEVNDQTEFAGFGLRAPPSIAMPVPATVWLFCSGLIGLIGIRMRK